MRDEEHMCLDLMIEIVLLLLHHFDCLVVNEWMNE